VLGLAAGDVTQLGTLKGLALAHARLGHRAAAQRAARKVVAMASNGRLFAARIDLYLGEAAAALERLGALADPEARRLKAWAHAWAGEAEAVKGLGAKTIRSGSREGEALLVAWFQARLFAKLGPGKAATMRKHFLDARVAAGRTPVEQATHRGTSLGTVKTAGWPARAVTWFRAPCGRFFQAGSGSVSANFDLGDGSKLTLSQSIGAEVACGEEKQTGSFNFNSRTIERKNGELPFAKLMGGGDKELADFKPAEKAFAAACAAWMDGRQGAADAACAQALKIEPGWTRLAVLRAVARALSPGGERRADAKEAAEAVKMWTDDFELRRTVLLLRAWAGDAQLPEAIQALGARELQLNIRKLGSLD